MLQIIYHPHPIATFDDLQSYVMPFTVTVLNPGIEESEDPDEKLEIAHRARHCIIWKNVMFVEEWSDVYLDYVDRDQAE